MVYLVNLLKHDVHVTLSPWRSFGTNVSSHKSKQAMTAPSGKHWMCSSQILNYYSPLLDDRSQRSNIARDHKTFETPGNLEINTGKEHLSLDMFHTLLLLYF